MEDGRSMRAVKDSLTSPLEGEMRNREDPRGHVQWEPL